MKDPLESIIGDAVRVRMLRLFVLNPEMIYTPKEFAKILRKNEPVVRSTLRTLERDGIVKKKKIPSARRKHEGVRETVGYGFNRRYAHQGFLEQIIRESMPTEKDVLAKNIARVPGVQCIITVDVFTDKSDDQVDLIVASSRQNEKMLRQLIQKAESTIGRELRCAFLTTNDLMHRIQTNDKFIRDVLDDRHRVHIDRAGILKRLG